MSSLNLKSIVSAVAALVVTTVVSWTFVHDTGVVWAKRGQGPDAVALVTALVR